MASTVALAWTSRPASDDFLSGEVIHWQQQNGREVSLRHPGGVFRSGTNEFGIRIVDLRTGQPVSASNVALDLFMPAMGAMQPMTATADVRPVVPWQWSGRIEVPMAGEWQVRVGFDSPAGRSEINFSTVAR